MLRIAFIISDLGISGGQNVIFEHASWLVGSGHDVYMLTTTKVDHKRSQWHHKSENLKKWVLVDQATEIEFDCVIVTFWITCYWTNKLKTKYFIYLNQSVESRFSSDSMAQNLAEATYLFGYHIITEASWIKTYLFEKYGLRAYLVRNGIDKRIFSHVGSSVAQRSDGKLRVLIEGSLEAPYKNVKKTIDLCRMSTADEIWLLTAGPFESGLAVDKVFLQLPIAETPCVYRSCDVIVKLSYVEGMFGPPLEMFHCGGTAIVYNVTGYDEYIVSGYNGIVVNTDDEDAVIKNINWLKANRQELKRLQENALETAQKWIDWSESSRQFENAIVDIINDSKANHDTVLNSTQIIRNLTAVADLDNAKKLDEKLHDWMLGLPLVKFLNISSRYIRKKISDKIKRIRVSLFHQ